MRIRTILAWIALGIASTCLTLQAQTTFVTITGTVVDATGAVVPKAVITVTNLETNYKTTGESNQSGTYTIPQLREGSYILAAKASGFQDFKTETILLASRDIRRVDVKL